MAGRLHLKKTWPWFASHGQGLIDEQSSVRLESELHSQLDVTRSPRAADLAVAGVVSITAAASAKSITVTVAPHVDPSPLRMVEGVKRLRPEL